MNVLLLYPEFPDTFWSFKHALKFIRRGASFPPLGLLTVAAMLPSDWNKRLVDTNVQQLTEEDLTWADLVLVSAMTVQRASARQLIGRCKTAGLTVIAGGPLFTVEYEQFPEVDHFVLNEGEITLPPFLEDFQAGRARRIYETDEHPDIRTTPSPLWHLARLDQYASMAIQYSRGCPFNCDFCNVTALLGHRPRVKTSGQIIHELDSLFAQGWEGPVFFVDDNLIGNKRELKGDLLPALIEWRQGKTGISFNTEASINLADDPHLMQMMVQAGFNTVFVGIETPDEEALIECSKLQNIKRNLVEDVRRIHQAGIQVQGGFIVGFDSDSPSIFQRQVEYIQKTGIVTAMVGMLQALPGTRLYDRMLAAGRLLGSGTGDNADGRTNIIPTMGEDVLHQGYRSLMRTIYAPVPYYQRIKTFLLDYKPPTLNEKSQIRPGHIMAFLRSIVRLGIIGRERFQYWRLIFWTLRHRRDQFSLAITLAIYGYHFRKTSELHMA